MAVRESKVLLNMDLRITLTTQIFFSKSLKKTRWRPLLTCRVDSVAQRLTAFLEDGGSVGAEGDGHWEVKDAWWMSLLSIVVCLCTFCGPGINTQMNPSIHKNFKLVIPQWMARIDTLHFLYGS